jgi:hypothetical protein
LSLDSNKDSNEFLSKSLRHYLTRNLFSFQLYPKRLAKNPLFGTISLHGPTGPLRNKNFLANYMSVNPEPFQRTDISTQPLGPINYTGSNALNVTNKSE